MRAKITEAKKSNPNFGESDLFITHMGYNTNAGAYYYYNREGDMSYEDTMDYGLK